MTRLYGWMEVCQWHITSGEAIVRQKVHKDDRRFVLSEEDSRDHEEKSRVNRRPCCAENQTGRQGE